MRGVMSQQNEAIRSAGSCTKRVRERAVTVARPCGRAGCHFDFMCSPCLWPSRTGSVHEPINLRPRLGNSTRALAPGRLAPSAVEQAGSLAITHIFWFCADGAADLSRWCSAAATSGKPVSIAFAPWQGRGTWAQGTSFLGFPLTSSTPAGVRGPAIPVPGIQLRCTNGPFRAKG
jgi:hypothetical protein